MAVMLILLIFITLPFVCQSSKLTGGFGHLVLKHFDEKFDYTNFPTGTSSAVKTVAIQVNKSDIFVKLSVPIQVVFPRTERYFTGNVSTTLSNRSVSFSIDGPLLKAFNIECNESFIDNATGGFQFTAPISSRVTYLVWRIVAWSRYDLIDIPVFSLSVDTRGSIVESLIGLSQLCSQNSSLNADGPPPVVVRGTLSLLASKGHVTIIGHNDEYDTTAKYYAAPSPTEDQVRCEGQCIPVILSLPRPLKGIEYACRPNRGDQALVWWNCGNFGNQQNLIGYSGRTLKRSRVAKSRNNSTIKEDDSCIDIRHNGRVGEWLRYNQTVGAYQHFAQDQPDSADNAYRCISTTDGAVLKEIYVEDSSQFVENCEIFPANTVNLAEIDVVTLQCNLNSYFNECKNNTADCSKKLDFTVESISTSDKASLNWQWAKFRHVVAMKTLMNSASEFVLLVQFNQNNVSNFFETLDGDYRILLHFKNNVSFLAAKFTLRYNGSHLNDTEETPEEIQPTLRNITRQIENLESNDPVSNISLTVIGSTQISNQVTTQIAKYNETTPPVERLVTTTTSSPTVTTSARIFSSPKLQRELGDVLGEKPDELIGSAAIAVMSREQNGGGTSSAPIRTYSGSMLILTILSLNCR